MYNQMNKWCVFLLLATFSYTELLAQENNEWKQNSYWSFGCNINFHYSHKQRFPGFRLFVGYANSFSKDYVMANYGANLCLYYKTIGNNLNPLNKDVQVDFTNSFTVGVTNNEVLNYYKNVRTIQNSNFYNLAVNKEYGLLATTNIVLNNHGRHQAGGSYTVSTPAVSLNYYNDGAAPISWLALGDNFDRYWTGGGCIYVHNTTANQNYNYAELSFDQFTGYTPLLYEMSKVLGIRIPSYDWVENNPKKRKKTKDFNTSEYRLKIFIDQNSAIDIGVIGSLRFGNKIWGVQDLIHYARKMPYHPNNDINRFFIGATYVQPNSLN